MQMCIQKIITQAKFQAFCTTFAFSYSNLLISLGVLPEESDAQFHICCSQWLIGLNIHLFCPSLIWLSFYPSLDFLFTDYGFLMFLGVQFPSAIKKFDKTIFLFALCIYLLSCLSMTIYFGASASLSPGYIEWV